MPDEIHIWVNESELPPPLPDDNRIVIHLAKDNNLTDIGKFAAADLAPEGIIILADDDLRYPRDYVETMIREVNRFNGEICVGLHGVVFPIGVKIDKIDDYFTQSFIQGAPLHTYLVMLSVLERWLTTKERFNLTILNGITIEWLISM